MARRVRVLFEDDIDGGPATETVTFALDGRDYEIDLSADNARKLRDTLAPWIAAGRRASTGARIPEARRAPDRRSPDTVDIRAWALDNGIPVSSRGRISLGLRSRYEAAH